MRKKRVYVSVPATMLASKVLHILGAVSTLIEPNDANFRNGYIEYDVKLLDEADIFVFCNPAEELKFHYEHLPTGVQAEFMRAMARHIPVFMIVSEDKGYSFYRVVDKGSGWFAGSTLYQGLAQEYKELVERCKLQPVVEQKKIPKDYDRRLLLG